MRRLRAAAMAAVLGVALALLPAFGIAGDAGPEPEPAAAAEASQFDPGYIISDALFYTGSALSVEGVQAFLKQKVPTCRSGYVCLKDYTQVTVAKAADRYCGGFGVHEFTAAQIIEGVARSCGISAKVLIVLLEKEQSLITDTWPTSRQYRSATGYGCPDTADCDTTYYGFFNQVYHAAKQYKVYKANPTNWRYQAGKSVFVQYNPNSACSGTNVYIQNAATAGLYIYTPYQPNAAALRNLYGSGDGCSAYGNRNFWRLYTDWFGPTDTYPVTGGIGEYYTAKGGATGTGIGFPTGNQFLIDEGGSGWKQQFAGGSIYWSPGTGASTVAGWIGVYYEKLGGPTGTSLGYPTGDQRAVGDPAGGWEQPYQNGRIYWSPATGTYAVTGGISLAYAAAGGPAGSLGYPIGEQVLANGSWSQKFQNATIYWTSGVTAIVRNAIQEGLDRIGGLAGAGLGHPIDGEYAVADGAGQRFSLGAIFTSPASGTWPVAGGIGLDYLAWGGPANSGLGFPTGRQRQVGGGWIQPFQNGSVYWNGASRIVSGGIGVAYEAAGGPEGSGLGYPTGNQTGDGTTSTQTFQFGRIDVVGGTATLTITDSARAAYYAAGGPLGPLGSAKAARAPIADTNGGWVERYTNGSLYGSATTASHRVSGGIGLAYEAAGGPVGSGIGFPIAESLPLGGSAKGWMQRFENGAVYWTPTGGGHVVAGEAAAAYDALGGATGSTGGYPIAAARTVNGVTTQQLTYGIAVWSAATGFYPVPGAIGAYWSAQGGVASGLGLPTALQTGIGQRFQNGFVYWSGATGAQQVAGGIGLHYQALGGPSGSGLGYPTGSQVEVDGGWLQTYQNGRIYWTPGTGAVVTSGGIGIDYVARRGHLSGLGFPVARQYPMGDGGWTQRFTDGRIYWSPATGARITVGGIGEHFAWLGGPSGSKLGYPTVDQQDLGSGKWAQYFQRGRINWPGPIVTRY